MSGATTCIEGFLLFSRGVKHKIVGKDLSVPTTTRKARNKEVREKKKRLDRAPHCYLAPAVQRRPRTLLRTWGSQCRRKGTAALINLFRGPKGDITVPLLQECLHLFPSWSYFCTVSAEGKKKEKDALWLNLGRSAGWESVLLQFWPPRRWWN